MAEQKGRASVVGPFGLIPTTPEETLNPFRNASVGLEDPFELLKTVLMFPVFVVRVVFFLAFFLVGVAFGNLTLAGWKRGGDM